MTRAVERAVAPLRPDELQRVMRHIDEHLAEPLRLAELSALVHVSPYHFVRRFKASTGVPPHRFVLQRRVERAKALLAARQLPITAIAPLVGFRTPSHFAAGFRRLTGLTPTAARGAESPGPVDGGSAAPLLHGPSADFVDVA